jgi:hypothetical protein
VDLAIDTEPDQDDPASDEGSALTREQQPAGADPEPALAAAAQVDQMPSSPVSPNA